MKDLPETFFALPESMPVLFMEAWNNRDAEALASLFANDAEFVNVVGLWWHDRKAIWKAHDYGLRVIFNQSHVKVGRVKKKMLSETISLVHARFTLTGQTETKGKPVPYKRQTLFSFVLQRHAQGWHCVSAHNTDIATGAETNIMDASGTLHPVSYSPPFIQP